MCKFFKITSSKSKPIVVASKNGWAGLIELCSKISEKDDGLIEPISLWKFIKYVVGLGD